MIYKWLEIFNFFNNNKKTSCRKKPSISTWITICSMYKILNTCWKLSTVVPPPPLSKTLSNVFLFLWLLWLNLDFSQKCVRVCILYLDFLHFSQKCVRVCILYIDLSFFILLLKRLKSLTSPPITYQIIFFI